MSAKLTLSIDEKTIARAKQISRKRGTSLSKIVEDYLNDIAENEDKRQTPSEKIEELMRPWLSKITVPEDGDYTKQVRDWQVEKYLRKAEG